MTVYYPKIAVFTYKDKELNIKVPLRIKLIELDSFKCNTCNTEASLWRWKRFFLRSMIFSSGDVSKTDTYWNDCSGMKNEEGKYICPKCKSILVPIKVKKLKIYYNFKNAHIRYADLLTRKTFFRFKDMHNRYGSSIYQIFDTIEDINRALELGVCGPQNKKQICELKACDKVTIEQLEKDLDGYKGRKLIKEI